MDRESEKGGDKGSSHNCGCVSYIINHVVKDEIQFKSTSIFTLLMTLQSSDLTTAFTVYVDNNKQSKLPYQQFQCVWAADGHWNTGQQSHLVALTSCLQPTED